METGVIYCKISGDVYDKDKSTEELKTIFGMLPLDIQCSAVSWGLADTIFRDEAYEWLEKNKNKT